MTLTGKCKIDFDEWIWESIYKKDDFWMQNIEFGVLPLSMQWGVYVDFFAENEIYIEITFNKPTKLELMKWWVDINGFEVTDNYEDEFDTLNEARLIAVKHANEIYNSQ